MQKYVENIKSDNFLYEFSFSRKLIVNLLYALENSDLMCFFFLFTVTSIQKLIKLLLLKKMSVKYFIKRIDFLENEAPKIIRFTFARITLHIFIFGKSALPMSLYSNLNCLQFNE